MTLMLTHRRLGHARAADGMMGDAWEQCEAFLDTLAGDLRSVVTKTITDRDLKSASQERAGIKFPLWFAEGFSNRQSELWMQDLMLSHLFLYLYVVMRDDMLDGDDQREMVAETVAGDLLITRATRMMSELSGAESRFGGYLETILQEWLRADLDLISRYKAGPDTVSLPDFPAYASKCAILKASGFVIATRTCDFDTWRLMSNAYDLLAMGDVLIDDWLDWETDLANRQLTYLLSTALDHLRLKGLPEVMTEVLVQDIRQAIYTGGGLQRSLLLATDHLTRASDIFTRVGCTSWADFTDSLLTGMRELSEHWRDSEVQWSDEDYSALERRAKQVLAST